MRIFLENDTHDVIFDATKCATYVPAQDTDNAFNVVAGDVRYDDDACTSGSSQKAWADVVAAHGDEIVSGIYVTAGFAGGQDLSASLRSLTVNDRVFTFGA